MPEDFFFLCARNVRSINECDLGDAKDIVISIPNLMSFMSCSVCPYNGHTKVLFVFVV